MCGEDNIGYFNGENRMHITQGNLPHWYQPNVITFVTFRLADSLPAVFWAQWNATRLEWLATHPPPHRDAVRREYIRQFERPVNHRLDQGHGSSLLGEVGPRTIVELALHHFHGTRIHLDEWVVASNHVHALMTPLGAHELGDTLRSIKGWSGKRILALEGALARLGCHQPGRTRPRVWQRESFDHLVRSEGELNQIRAYIRNHPTYRA